MPVMATVFEVDQYAKWAADVFANAVTSCTGPREDLVQACIP